MNNLFTILFWMFIGVVLFKACTSKGCEYRSDKTGIYIQEIP